MKQACIAPRRDQPSLRLLLTRAVLLAGGSLALAGCPQRQAAAPEATVSVENAAPAAAPPVGSAPQAAAGAGPDSSITAASTGALVASCTQVQQYEVTFVL